MLAGCQQEQPVEDHEREEEAVEHGEVDGLPLAACRAVSPACRNASIVIAIPPAPATVTMRVAATPASSDARGVGALQPRVDLRSSHT